MEAPDVEIERLHSQLEPSLKQEVQPLLTAEVILPWVEGIPRKPGKVLDIGGGVGIEARVLTEKGFDVLNLDVSSDSLKASLHDRNVQARVAQIPFADGSFSGALLKDVFVLLPPAAREQFFSEVKRVLVTGGSLLVVSELNPDLRIHYMVPDSKYPLRAAFPDQTGWSSKLAGLKDVQELIGVEFISTPDEVRRLAERNGFTLRLLKEYGPRDPFVSENRLAKRGGFMAEFRSQ